MKIKLDLTGRRFDKLVVICREGSRGTTPLWLCLCECGNHVARTKQDLLAPYLHACRNSRRAFSGLSRGSNGKLLPKTVN